MTTNRRFAHFEQGNVPPRFGKIPEGGFCISAFVILLNRSNSKEVLMGRIKTEAAWDHIGGLDPRRVERHRHGWMLPSSGLIFGESPQEAAIRILKEQVETTDLHLDGPQVFSELYGQPDHWDLEFVFLGKLDRVPISSVWEKLTFVDLSVAKREDFARGHEDILAHVGMFKK